MHHLCAYKIIYYIWSVCQKLHMYVTLDVELLFFESYAMHIIAYLQKVYVQVCMLPCITVNDWKQPECLSVVNCFNKLWYIMLWKAR